MDVVLRTSDGDAELSLGSLNHDDLITDLVRDVIGRPCPGAVNIDGRVLPADTTLATAGLLNGSIISLDVDDVVRRGHTSLELAQIAGPGAGAVTALWPGRFQVGRSKHPNVSPLKHAPVHEAAFEIYLSPDGTTSVRSIYPDAGITLDETPLTHDRFETWSGGVVRAGERAFELRRADKVGSGATRRRVVAMSSDGTAPFNRPPRPQVEDVARTVEVPDGGQVVGDSRRFPLLAMLAPLPIAVGMALMLGSPRFMLFGLMSPVMAGANWISDRRDRKRQLGESTRADAEATAAFTATVERERVREREKRRASHPHLVDAVQMASAASPELWQRRAGDPDVFRLSLGVADLEWQPTLERTSSSLASADAIVQAAAHMSSVPITVDFLHERGLGVVGSDDFTDAAVRGLLVQAAVTHGPADIDIVIATSPDRAADWEWTKWLPHVRGGGSPRVLAEAGEIGRWASAVRHAWEKPQRPELPRHITIVVLDDPLWWRDRSAPMRPLLSDATMPIRFVVLTDMAEKVPAVCTTLVAETADTLATVSYLNERRDVHDVVPFLVDPETAEGVARSLAPLDDPDLPVESAGALPSTVPILRLLGLDDPEPADMMQRWQRAGVPARPVVQAGVGDRGVVEIDLVDDGPHGLIAGTTGAGKSELLRSLVVGLAANLAPNDINFVLVDFKGGSAFDACADLPHTVGLVTDLDEHLAGRVLRCLQAELHYREVELRNAGASSLIEYQMMPGLSPLPRLVLVVDEFASVAAELPEFLPALVDVAQRGRSLGIHMILATQRPAGVVDNKIKANTNLRIALRVQDDGDSLDVINTKDAALLPRQTPGRAYARFGAGELTMFQSAYASGVSDGEQRVGVDVRPFVVGRNLTQIEQRMLQHRQACRVVDSPDAETDLSKLVGAISRAAQHLGQTDQRRPYPDPLPERLELSSFLLQHPGPGVPFALVDLPDEQRQVARRWHPGPDGSMAVYGITGAGTSSLLISLALGLAQRTSADDAHLYIIDADANSLDPLGALPHAGAVITLDQLDRVARLTRVLSAEIDRRKQLAIRLGGPAQVVGSEPAIIVMVDNIGALRQVLDESKEYDGLWSDFERVLRDGQSVGLCAVVTAKQERALPSSLATQIPERLVMRLGDQFGYAGFGFRPVEVPTFVPGRALRPDDKTEVQVCLPPDDIAGAIDSLGLEPATRRPPRRVDPLPHSIGIDQIVVSSARLDRGLSLTVGLDTSSGDPAHLVIPFGENALVVGAAGSGRSSMLAALAIAARHVDPLMEVHAVTPRGGPLANVDGLDGPSSPADVSAWVDRLESSANPRIVLVDDADRIGGPSFERLAALRDDGLIVVVAGRADDLRNLGHWSKPLQRNRNGVLIRPTQTDGELLRVSLGHRLPRFAPHRGVVVSDGEAAPLLAASVTLQTAEASL